MRTDSYDKRAYWEPERVHESSETILITILSVIAEIKDIMNMAERDHW